MRESPAAQGAATAIADRSSAAVPTVRVIAAACLLALLSAITAFGQQSNLALYQQLAVECLGDLPASVDSLVLEAPANMPYVRSALVSRWHDDGRAVFLSDSTFHGAFLSYNVDEARVEYERRRRRLARRIRLALRYTLTNGDGRVVADDRCVNVHSDVIPRGEVAAVQDNAYPETQGDLPEGGWFRRYLEPVVITAATGVAVYLFFTLRSRRADDS